MIMDTNTAEWLLGLSDMLGPLFERRGLGIAAVVFDPDTADIHALIAHPQSGSDNGMAITKGIMQLAIKAIDEGEFDASEDEDKDWDEDEDTSSAT